MDLALEIWSGDDKSMVGSCSVPAILTFHSTIPLLRRKIRTEGPVPLPHANNLSHVYYLKSCRFVSQFDFAHYSLSLHTYH